MGRTKFVSFFKRIPSERMKLSFGAFGRAREGFLQHQCPVISLMPAFFFFFFCDFRDPRALMMTPVSNPGM